MIWQRANKLTQAGEPIAGFRLYAPTIGHALVLSDLGIDIYAIEEFPDLLMSAFVLAHRDHEDAERDLSAWWCPTFLRWWGKRAGANGGHEKHAEAFRDFLRANTSEVETVTDSSKPSKRMSSPWAWRLYAALVGEMGMTRAEALATPILEAQLLTTALYEMRGQLELLSDRERGFLEWCEEQDRLKAHGTNPHPGEAWD